MRRGRSFLLRVGGIGLKSKIVAISVFARAHSKFSQHRYFIRKAGHVAGLGIA